LIATLSAQFGSIDPVFYNKWDFDNNIPTGVKRVPFTGPSGYFLSRNFPNPFNPVTQISYSLPRGEFVRFTVYNVRGEEVLTVVDKKQQAGTYVVTWNGRNDSGEQVSSGIYFYRIETESFSQTRKMTLLK